MAGFWSLCLVALLEAVEAHGQHGHDHGPDSHLLKRVSEALQLIPEEYQALVHKALGPAEPKPIDVPSVPLNADTLFMSSPLANGLRAVAIMTIVTSTILALLPPLSGLVLQFLVAFAEGGLLGNVFLHLLPEVHGQSAGLIVIFAFLLFVAIGELLGGHDHGDSQHSHGHSHGHSHTHSLDENLDEKLAQESQEVGTSSLSSGSSSGASSGSTRPGELSRRVGSTEVRKRTDNPVPPKPSKAESGFSLAIINVAADILHNIADGVALGMAFKRGPEHGAFSFVLMCCHEIPHQVGDFAVIIQNGLSRKVGIVAQLITSLGTVVGCALGTSVNDDSWLFKDAGVVSAFAAGVFLYLATVGVLPELTEALQGTKTNKLLTGLVQVAGIAAGVTLMATIG